MQDLTTYTNNISLKCDYITSYTCTIVTPMEPLTNYTNQGSYTSYWVLRGARAKIGKKFQNYTRHWYNISTQNLKEIGIWVISLIYLIFSTLIVDVRINHWYLNQTNLISNIRYQSFWFNSKKYMIATLFDLPHQKRKVILEKCCLERFCYEIFGC